MKTILTIAFAALLSGSAFCHDPPPPTLGGEVVTDTDTVNQKTRRFWVRAKGFLSEEMATFKEDALQTLAELAKEIDQTAAKAGTGAPVYFLTRLQALRQQHENLSLRLQGLTAEEIRDRLSGPRYAFDKCISSLEAALDQAEKEADVLAKLNTPAKIEARQ